MDKKQARDIAINYLLNAGYAFTDISAKYPINDSGTMSKDGYTYEDCEVIQKEIEFLQKKLLSLEIKGKKIKTP